MLVEPKLQEVIVGPRGMLPGIEACLERECLVSAVTLIFAAIDALAALTRPVGQLETDGDTFRAWADRFMPPEKHVGCTAQDLWGARCGVLHTYSPEAARAARFGARRVYYQWRQGPAADAARALPVGSIVVIVEDLHGALVNAANSYMVETATDGNLQAQLKDHLPSLLCYEPFPILTGAAGS